METLTHIISYYEAYLILAVVGGIVICIFTDLLSPSNSFILGTLILILCGVTKVESFLISFSNKQLVTIFLLIFITVAIRQNTNINALFDRWFRRDDPPRIFLLKLSTTVAVFSSFLNNTPIVSVLMNNVQLWAKRRNLSPSKFLIPLSFAAILGGIITVIGTSTNLVLFGLLSSTGEPLLSHWDFLVVGSAVCISGIAYLLLFSNRILPDRKMALSQFSDNIGEYIHEVELEDVNDLVGKTVIDAGLKNLQGIYLVEISRNGETITPVSPDTVIERGDHFYFAGDTEQLVNFVETANGLKLPSQEELERLGESNIVEVVIAANSRLDGLLVKDSLFRQRYNASIIGIHRNGEKISGKIGHVKLKSGDLLLLLSGSDFENRIAHDKGLYLLSEIRKSWQKPLTKRSWFYRILQILTVLAVLDGLLSFFMGLLISLFLLILFRFLSIDSIKNNFDFDLLMVLACSITLGKVFIDSGAADIVSSGFLQMMPKQSPKLVLSFLFFFTVILTSLITNVAAVSIAFPIAYSLAHQLGMMGAPLYLAIALAASASFITPMGYQTNMMVYGPGGYRSIDFLKIGLPLLGIYSLVSLFMMYWWFGL